MRLLIKSLPQIIDELANTIKKLVETKPNAVISLPFNPLLFPLYDQLLDFPLVQVTFIGQSEFIGLTGNDEHSFRRMFDEKLFNHIEKAEAYLPCGIDEIEENCQFYDQLIEEKGIDLLILDQNVAFNSSLDLASTTHIEGKYITLGHKNFLQAKQLILFILEDEKISLLIEENSYLPTSIVKFHRDSTLYIDHFSASKLNR